MLDDDLVDLRALAPPVAVHALAPADAGALDDLAAVGEREPLPQPAGLVEQGHERQLLHHIPAAAPGVPLGEVAAHLALPNSSASVLVKDLARRGFVRRTRDRRDERRLALVLTCSGAERVAADSVLDGSRLTAAPAALDASERRALVSALERVAEAGAALPPSPPRRRRRARSTS